jgi:hypothetical protein
LSKKKPTKTKFNDLWRDDAMCLFVAATEEDMQTAWDNVDVGTWETAAYAPDPAENVAKTLCVSSCPVREKCLRDALSDNEVDGIRGGFRFENGNVSMSDAKVIFNEFSLRARVRKRMSNGSNEV